MSRGQKFFWWLVLALLVFFIIGYKAHGADAPAVPKVGLPSPALPGPPLPPRISLPRIEHGGQTLMRLARRTNADRTRTLSGQAQLLTVPATKTLNAPILSIARDGEGVVVLWSGGVPPFQLQRSSDLGIWQNVGEVSSDQQRVLPIDSQRCFFRVASQVSIPGAFSWVRGAITDSGYGYVTAVATDSAGNVYSAGYWNNIADFGNGPVHSVSQAADAFIVKYSPDGELLWRKQIGGTGTDTILGVTVDAADNVVVCGNFQGAVDFGGGAVTAISGNEMFVAKYSSDGGYLWAQHYRSMAAVGGSTGGGGSLVCNGAGDVFVVATVAYGADFGGFPMTPVGGPADYDFAIAELSGATGATIWARSYGGIYGDSVRAIALDSAGDLVVVGQIAGPSTDLGGGAISASGSFNAFVVKYHGSNGAVVWQQICGNSGGNAANGVAIDAAGNVVVTGYFSGSINFGSGFVGGGGGVFLLGLSPAGSFQWVKTTGNGSDAGAAVKISGNTLAAAGKAAAGMYFGTGQSVFGNGQVNGWVAGFSLNGASAPTNTWLRVYGNGTDGASAAMAVAIDGQGHVIDSGGFLATINFGDGSGTMTAGTAGYPSGFLSKQ